MLSFFFAHRAVVFFYCYLPHASYNPLIGLASIIVFAASVLYIFFRFRFNVWYLGILFFAGMLVSYLMHQALGKEESLLYADILQGFGYMGYIVSYYLLGSTLKRQADYRRFRLIILVIFVCSMVLHVVPGTLNQRVPQHMPLIGGLMTLGFFILFALLSPVFSDEVFSRAQEDPALRRRQRMQQYGLTAREQEIVLLLLQGNLLKECAAALDISLDTVKFHSRNIYKKLGISGRNELLNAFKDA